MPTTKLYDFARIFFGYVYRKQFNRFTLYAVDFLDYYVWTVFGRGVLHLSVLIETMRREGYELQVGQPQVM